MRKLFITAILIFLFFNVGFAQVNLGLKFSPTFVVNRLTEQSGTANASKGGTGFTAEFGLITDFGFDEEEKYFFSTGLLYLSKSVKLNVSEEFAGNFSNDYNIQYLRLPATLKMKTNEIALDKRLYFQIVGNFDFKVHDKSDQENNQVINKFRPIDISFVFGTGIEFKLGTTTTLFAGLNYNHGLINAVKSTDAAFFDKLIVKNNSIGIDFGLRF
jgi:hypothetical protein